MNESVRVIPSGDESGILVQARFKEFLECFKGEGTNDLRQVEDGPSQQKTLSDYKAQIISMIQNNKSTIYVNFNHIQDIDHELAEAIELEYYRFEPFLRQAVQDIVAAENKDYFFDVDRGQRHFFVSLYNLQRIERIRSMTTSKIGRLVSISGTVTRSSEVRPELLYGIFDCTKCDAVDILVEQQYQYTEPKVCPTSRCDCTNFRLALTKSAFVDWQRLRVQENADEVPPGSMPRCIDVICRNEVCEVAKAGDKVVFTGNIAVVPDTSGLARVGESTVGGKSSGGRGESYVDGVKGLKALGVKEMTYKMLFIACSVQHTEQRTGRHAVTLAEISGMGDEMAEERDAGMIDLTAAEKEDILAMRNTPHLYNKMADSICPSVFGHSEVKRGVLLMLFGGVHKKTKEGISLRGDLNVCIVGDPSCAKSQFLKYVHGFLPRTIYTSGKSSSAAGLTASVVRDSDTGEFCVEAGALMLADNGICCIDEFDKMDVSDQVAIHEAMEQQTISITKAGIQATLNARTSILAAANPVFGRYDRGKTLKANVAVSAAIMSRFDLFFVILDECNPDIDESIARHIIHVHKEGGVDQVCTAAAFSREQLQRYISFARSINPTLSIPARKTLVECYRLLRQNDILGKNKTAYRITVRQLESLIRLSEALARLHLDEKVQPVYVREAYRLLQKSIIFVENEDVELDDNEEEMNQLDTQYKKKKGKRRRTESQGDVSDGDDEEQEQMGSESRHKINTEAVAASYESQQSSSMQIPSEGVNSVSPGGSNEETAVIQKKKKAKTQISAKEYEDITHLLCLRLKTLEEEFSTARSDESVETYYPGCTWTDLLTWYMKQLRSELIGEEQFEQKKKLVNQIIRRMIKHEGSVIELRATSGDEGEEQERKLKLHPSFQP